MSTYDLKTLKLPKLSGNWLAIFANFLETKLGKAILLNSLLENGGIPKLRMKDVEDVPTFYPLVKPKVVLKKPVGFHETESQGNTLSFFTVYDYGKAYQDNSSNPVEIAEQFWRNIQSSEQLEKPMRLFSSTNKEDIFNQAEIAAKRVQDGQRLSPLDGVPIAIKDEVDMYPYPTTVGTSFLGKSPVFEDSTVVARLRSAGALLVGKTNMHEIGIAPNGLNVHHGTVRNPYNLDSDPGGSSSGSAAVVAAGLIPVAIGADGGGSIRIPAALCGVVGLKPTYGRISENGAFPLCWSVAHLGPIAASVYDAALVYSIIAGPDPKDENTLIQPPVNLENWNKPDLHGLRLGVYPEWNEHADPEIVLGVREMLAKFEKRGAEIIEIKIPELDEMRISHAVTILSEMALCMRPHKSRRKEMGESVRLSLILGEELTSSDYLQAQRYRTRALRIFEDIYSKVDSIISPATAKTAQPIPVSNSSMGWSDLSTDTEYMRFIFPGNLTGLPAISFPIGYDSKGLPIGMHAMSNHWQENVLLRVAFNAEQELERKIPQHYFPSLIQ